MQVITLVAVLLTCAHAQRHPSPRVKRSLRFNPLKGLIRVGHYDYPYNGFELGHLSRRTTTTSRPTPGRQKLTNLTVKPSPRTTRLPWNDSPRTTRLPWSSDSPTQQTHTQETTSAQSSTSFSPTSPPPTSLSSSSSSNLPVSPTNQSPNSSPVSETSTFELATTSDTNTAEFTDSGAQPAYQTTPDVQFSTQSSTLAPSPRPSPSRPSSPNTRPSPSSPTHPPKPPTLDPNPPTPPTVSHTPLIFPPYSTTPAPRTTPGIPDCPCIHGRCVKIPNYSNWSCLCDPGYYGPNCGFLKTGDCDDKVCHDVNGLECVIVRHFGKMCVCKYGYLPPTDIYKRTCRTFNVCDEMTPCPTNEICVGNNTNEGYSHSCECASGFSRVNGTCKPTPTVSPCTNVTCQENAKCTVFNSHLLPSPKSSCECMEGYKEYEPHKCTGNLLQELKSLNDNDKKLKGTLTLSLAYLERFFKKEITQSGPFTIFIPIDKAFRGLIALHDGFDKLMENKDRAMQIMRQHMLIGRFTTQQLSRYNSFYTLQGNKALLQIKRYRGVFKYKLADERPKTKVLKSNVRATNGMINIVNVVLTTRPSVDGDPKITAYDLMTKTTRHYLIMAELIRIAGLEKLFTVRNNTFLGVSDDAWTSLPTGTLEYLKTTKDGKAKLKEILSNHVLPGAWEITSLIKDGSIYKTLAHVYVGFTVSKQGQVMLNNQSGIVQADILVSNGYIQHIDKVFLPPTMRKTIVNNFCNTHKLTLVQGRCMPCWRRGRRRSPICPRQGDKYLESTSCGGYRCRAKCQRKTEIRECCEGFYGSKCIPCPSSYEGDVCYGRGTCDQGYRGTGKCTCSADFDGDACSRCKQANKYGPKCDRDCKCQHGVCKDGPRGDGHCLVCHNDNYLLPDCDTALKPCSASVAIACHVHAECYEIKPVKEFSCRCLPGYEGNGHSQCDKVDLCKKTFNGGCHQQATCTQISHEMVRCDCVEGWRGDGRFCAPILPCDDDPELCHVNATCTNLEPGEHKCECNEGFIKDGDGCKSEDPCLEFNGGCDLLAVCVPQPRNDFQDRNDPLERTCVCPPNTYQDTEGDCFSTIAEQVMARPELSTLAKYVMKKIPHEDSLLAQPNQSFTLLAPYNSAGYEHFLRFGENMAIDFMNFHTLDQAYTFDELAAVAPIQRLFPTLHDGFARHIIHEKNVIFIAVKPFQFARIIEKDLMTTNGVIHLVDKVMWPFSASKFNMNPPTIEEFLQSDEKFSDFYQAINKSGLLKELMSMNEFTLFVPSNSFLERHALPDYYKMSEAWKYYAVPQFIYSASLYQESVLYATTLLGERHQLVITEDSFSLLVNDLSMKESDIIVDSGIVHIIEGVLRPVLNWCNITSGVLNPDGLETTAGDCQNCSGKNASELQCPEGFGVLHPLTKDYCSTYNSRYVEGLVNPQFDPNYCHPICGRRRKKEVRCCAGFYGKHCSECPGGAQRPCSGHGQCLDDLAGDGTCLCDPGFHGDDCSLCEDLSLAQPHCDLTHPLCKNAKCHENAICSARAHEDDRCRCKPGYHGDGRVQCTQNRNPCLSEDYGGCDKERASCDYFPPAVDDLEDGKPFCECTKDYVGDGRVCSLDVFDAITRLPDLEYFVDVLQKTDANFTSLLQDLNVEMTLFASTAKTFDNVNFRDLIVVGSTLVLPSTLEGEPSPYYNVFYDNNNNNNNNYNKDSNNSSSNHNDNVTTTFSLPQLTHVASLTSLSGDKINITVDASGQYFANDVLITRTNVGSLNGVVHLTEFPVVYVEPKVAASSGSSTDTTLVIICVAVALGVFLIVVIGTVVYFRSRRAGMFNAYKRDYSGSDTNVSFARLKAQGDDEDESSVRCSSAAKYDNPIFEDLN